MVRSYAHPKFDGLALLEFQAIKPLRAVSDLKVKEESNDEADPVLRSERFRAVAGTSRFCRETGRKAFQKWNHRDWKEKTVNEYGEALIHEEHITNDLRHDRSGRLRSPGKTSRRSA